MKRSSLGSSSVDDTLAHLDRVTQKLVRKWDTAREDKDCLVMYGTAMLISKLAGEADSAFLPAPATARRRKLWSDIQWRRQDIGGRTMSCLKRKSAM